MKTNYLKETFIILVFLLSGIVQAQTWTGLGDVNNWNDPANWSSSPSLPSNGANITIDGSPVTLSISSSFIPADIRIINGGSLNIATGGSILASDDISITGSTSSLTVSGGNIAGADNMLITDGTVTIFSGELDLSGRLDFTGGTLDLQSGLLDLNGSGSSDDLTLNGTTFTMSGGTIENDRGITATNGTFDISGGTINQNGSGSSDDMLFNGTAVTFSGGSVINDQELFVNNGSLNIESGSTYYSDENLKLTGSAMGNFSGTIDLEYNVSPTDGGDLSLFGTSVVNINAGSNIKMDDLVLNDDGQSSTVNIYGTLTAFDDIKFDEDPPDDVAGDSDQIIVKDGGTLTITDSFRDADAAESGSRIHAESGATVSIGEIDGITVEEAYGTVITSDNGATMTVGSGDPLPVELIFFKGKVINETVELKWLTATEINNAYFELLRSTDGENFTPIARIEGSGNTDNIVSYSYQDRDVFQGIYYYQLKQVDFNGEFEHHYIISVQFQGKENSKFTVYPNPAISSMLTINAYINVPKPVAIIYSMEGDLLFENSLESGSKWSFQKSQLGLGNGTYIVKIIDEISGIEIGASRVKIID